MQGWKMHVLLQWLCNNVAIMFIDYFVQLDDLGECYKINPTSVIHYLLKWG